MKQRDRRLGWTYLVKHEQLADDYMSFVDMSHSLYASPVIKVLA